jgi:hypothetical protein
MIIGEQFVNQIIITTAEDEVLAVISDSEIIEKDEIRVAIDRG